MGMGKLDDHSRYQTLDGWRGVACLLVVIFHSAMHAVHDPSGETPHGLLRAIYVPIAHGYIGVGLFFVISGYCISATCDSTRRKGKARGGFFVRRIRRIYPPYLIWLGITIASIVGLSQLGGGHLLPGVENPLCLTNAQWVGNMTLTEQWRPNLGGGPGLWVIGQAWSLSYEEQFYVVCGLVLVFWPRRFFSILFTVTMVVACATAYQYRFGSLSCVDGFFFDGRWLLFAAGIMVYFRLKYASHRQALLLDSILTLSSILACIVAWRHPYWHHIERAAALVLAVALVHLYHWDSSIAANPFVKLLMACGRMCYSLYLVQWPLVKIISRLMYDAGIQSAWQTVLLTIPVCTAISLLVAVAFYTLVERRFLSPRVSVAASAEGFCLSPAIPDVT